jgi:ketosteroid isomerase-like protein
MRKAGLLLLMICASVGASPDQGSTKVAPEDPAHNELRALRNNLKEAINKNDIDALLTHLDKDVVITWMNGEVSRKPQGVREYIERMTKGDKRLVNSYTTEPEVDELTHLYGDTGVATGHSKDHFVLTDGSDFVVETRWTATLVKKDGKWLVAGFHASTNMFDNPVLDIAVRRTATWVGAAAGVGGGVIGLGIGWLLFRRRRGA